MVMTEFAQGFWFGFLLVPFYTVVKIMCTLAINAWNATQNCTGDCNQGRNCNCEKKNESV